MAKVAKTMSNRVAPAPSAGDGTTAEPEPGGYPGLDIPEDSGAEEEGEEGDTVLRSGRLPFDVHLLAAVAASQPVALLCLNAFLC